MAIEWHWLLFAKHDKHLIDYFCTHLVLDFPFFLEVLEALSVIPVAQFVTGYPLIVFLPALCCYTCDFNVLTSQINLEPLPCIPLASWPSTLCPLCRLKE